ncbi:MAG TPA: hemolysin family protein [Pseudolabrys sp.]|nr:hemolysin family protein [Pseudolabrys sp.]
MFPPDSGSGDSGGGGSYEPRNLPVPVPLPSQVARNGNGETWIGRALRALFGWKPGSIRADLKDVLEAGLHGESGFSPEESAMLKNILGLRERRVDDVMVPRADIIAVQQDISLGELVRVFENAGHSRLVAYNDTLDDPIGMVHIRDLIAFMTARAAVSPEANAKRKKPLPANLDLKAVDLSLPLSSTKIVREILFVPPSMRLIDLLAKMQATRIHLALVIDEYGGTDGLISIEDVVEQIVGEIEDEHDEDKAPDIARQNDDSFVADARASLEEVIRVVGVDFNVGDAAEDVDTIGGYLMTKAGRVPVRGELFPGPDSFEIEVLDADPRRVKRLRIYRLKDRRARSRESKRRDADGVPATAGATPAEEPRKDVDAAGKSTSKAAGRP